MAAQDIKLPPAGLWTAPAVLEAPRGGLATAKEVVIRRQGIVQPRPGFDNNATLSAPSWVKYIPFGATYIQVRTTSESPITEWQDGTDILNEDAANLAWLDDAVYGAEASKNLYITTSDGLRKLTSSSDTVAVRAGAPVPSVAAAISATNGNAILAESYVGYTALTKREDENGLVIRSGVSGRALVFNASATDAKRVNVGVYLHPDEDWQVGDFLEVYRTFSEPTIPSNESYLVKSIKIDSTILTAGIVTFEDNALDEPRANVAGGLGATLYTSTSRDGLAANHIRPPACTYVERFNGSLFLSDLKFPAEQIISWSPAFPASPLASGVGTRSIAGDFTNGSANITNVTPTTGLQIGQIIDNVLSEWATNTQYVRITGISGSTVTMSQTYGGATGNKTRSFYDSIKIDSLYFPADTVANFVAAVRGEELVSINPGGHSAAVNVTANGLGDFALDVDQDRERRYVQIVAVGPSVTPFVLNATHGDQYEPPLPLPTVAGLTAPQETQPAGIMWSNNLEPEHFTLENVDLLGSASRRIMAIRSVKNALLGFKEDGVYRVSGAGAESGFRFDDLDRDVRLIYSAATAVLGDHVYAWGDQGVFECNENGCTNISKPAVNELTIIQQTVSYGNRTAHGVWATANRRDNEVVFSAPALGALTTGERLYVFNRETGTWVNWLVGGTLKGGTYFGQSSTTLVVADGTKRKHERIPNTSDELYGADDSIIINISAVSGTDITIDGGSGWTPVVGDMLEKSGVFTLVTAVTDATHFTVTDTVTTGAGRGHVAMSSEVSWIANTAKNPGLLKSWGEGAVWWTSLYGLRDYGTSFTSSVSATPVTQSKNLTTTRITTVFSEALRFVTPRNHARTTRLYPKVTVRQAGSRWAIEAISLGYMYMSDRVRTK